MIVALISNALELMAHSRSVSQPMWMGISVLSGKTSDAVAVPASTSMTMWSSSSLGSGIVMTGTRGGKAIACRKRIVISRDGDEWLAAKRPIGRHTYLQGALGRRFFAGGPLLHVLGQS